MEPRPCPDCGFAPRTVSPADAAVAVRSYPRRYRALLEPPDDEQEPGPEDLVRRRPPGGGWSAIDHAAWVAGVFSLAADALERTRVQDQPAVEIAPQDPEVAADAEAGQVLERLTTEAERLAGAIGGTGAPDWTRTGRLPDGRELSAIDLARNAVHQGYHHLRQTEQLLVQLRGRP